MANPKKNTDLIMRSPYNEERSILRKINFFLFCVTTFSSLSQIWEKRQMGEQRLGRKPWARGHHLHLQHRPHSHDGGHDDKMYPIAEVQLRET